ncbi:Auxin-responsive protein IAA26-like protein [Drosera capensis]
MEGDPRNSIGCPNLIDLMPWMPKNHDEKRIHGSNEKKLELSLAPPGEPIWSSDSNNGYPKKERDASLFSLGHLTHNNQNKRNDVGTSWPSQVYQQHHRHQQEQLQKHQQQSAKVSFLQQYQTGPGGVSIGKESSQRMAEIQNGVKNKAFSSSSPPANTSVPTNNSSHKRAAPAPVVGWPPLRSFRKSLASSSSGKTSPEPGGKATKTTENEKPFENSRKGLFVKINMDGVPIGRKINLHAYDTYDKLSVAVDELFRGLLAAQKDPSSTGNQTQVKEEKAITGLLDGKGEYTLVYEDSEGDRMLVGDVPWHMFVSNVKRLRVLKSSDLPSLNRNGKRQEKEVLMECAA